MEEKTIEQILAKEKKMFLTVKSINKDPCQKDIDSFLLYRRAQFVPWNHETLRSYLHDLEIASQQGLNLMTLKYARMEDKIPVLNSNPLITEIVRISKSWQQDMIAGYPHIMRGARPIEENDFALLVNYTDYLRCELETYSDSTIRFLHDLVILKKSNNINMSEEVYSFLISQMGYKSLRDAEYRMAQKAERGS